MSKPLVEYKFTIMTDSERDAFLTAMESQSWETALLDGKMLRFDRRPRFSQMFRLKVEKSETPVVRSLTQNGTCYLWLEAATDEE